MKGIAIARTIIIGAALALTGLLTAYAEDPRCQSAPVLSMLHGNEAVRGCLIGNTETVVPGKPFLVGLLLQPQPGWRVYARTPGDMGWPLSIDWRLPAGFAASTTRWPKSKMISDSGVKLRAYDGETLVICEITPPQTLSETNIVIKARVQWACGNGRVSLLPVDAEVILPLTSGQSHRPANTALFARHNPIPHG